MVYLAFLQKNVRAKLKLFWKIQSVPKQENLFSLKKASSLRRQPFLKISMQIKLTL